MSAIYIGGLIGPFSGQSIAVILPDVAHTFDISLEQAAFTMAAYLFPFATLMLFSTRLVRNLRPRQVILWAYVST
ncbi:MAG: MFS transporter, partial [Corynebacterium sp.]|nr:MFS transporter [Corynebacterium sp.]